MTEDTMPYPPLPHLYVVEIGGTAYVKGDDAMHALHAYVTADRAQFAATPSPQPSVSAPLPLAAAVSGEPVAWGQPDVLRRMGLEGGDDYGTIRNRMGTKYRCPLFLAPPARVVRMLTPAERFDVGLKESVRIADIEAIQRKFAEVNGLSVGDGKEVV